MKRVFDFLITMAVCQVFAAFLLAVCVWPLFVFENMLFKVLLTVALSCGTILSASVYRKVFYND